jgi:hypothetical protein
VKKYCEIRYIAAYRDTIVWPINQLNVKVFDEICSDIGI